MNKAGGRGLSHGLLTTPKFTFMIYQIPNALKNISEKTIARIFLGTLTLKIHQMEKEILIRLTSKYSLQSKDFRFFILKVTLIC